MWASHLAEFQHFSNQWKQYLQMLHCYLCCLIPFIVFIHLLHTNSTHPPATFSSQQLCKYSVSLSPPLTVFHWARSCDQLRTVVLLCFHVINERKHKHEKRLVFHTKYVLYLYTMLNVESKSLQLSVFSLQIYEQHRPWTAGSKARARCELRKSHESVSLCAPRNTRLKQCFLSLW